VSDVQPAPPKRRLRFIVGIVGYAAVLTVAWTSIDRVKFAAGIAHLRVVDVCAVLALSVLHISGRGARFHWLVRSANPSSDYRFVRGFSIFLAGLSAGAVTPARAGDLVKAELLARYDVPRSAGVGLVLVERVLDLVVMATTISAAAIVVGGPSQWGRLAVGLLAILLAGLFVVSRGRWRRAGLTFIRGRVAAKSVRISDLLDALERMLEVWDPLFAAPRRLGALLVGSIAVWSSEFGKLWVLLRLLGHDVPIAVVFFAYPVSVIAGVLTLLPFAEGVVAVTGVALLGSLCGLDTAAATLAVTLDRVASCAPPLVLWLLFAALERAVRGREPSSAAPPH